MMTSASSDMSLMDLLIERDNSLLKGEVKDETYNDDNIVVSFLSCWNFFSDICHPSTTLTCTTKACRSSGERIPESVIFQRISVSIGSFPNRVKISWFHRMSMLIARTLACVLLHFLVPYGSFQTIVNQWFLIENFWLVRANK